jgi:glycosyltransferase involved in cell wall biosynthesis
MAEAAARSEAHPTQGSGDDDLCELLSPSLGRTLLEAIRGARHSGSFIDFVGAAVARNVPYATDPFSRLRYTAALLERLLCSRAYRTTGRQLRALQGLRAASLHPLEAAAFLELQYLTRLQAGEDPGRLLRGAKQLPRRLALLRALLRAGTAAPPTPPPAPAALLAAGAGSSYSAALVRDLVRATLPLWTQTERATFQERLRRRALQRGLPLPQRLYALQLLAEHRLRALHPSELARLWEQEHEGAPELRAALMVLAAECGYAELLPLFHRELLGLRKLPGELQLILLQTLAFVGGAETADLLEQQGFRAPGGDRADGGGGGEGRSDGWLPELGGLALRYLREGRSAPALPGPILAQAVLNPNRQDSGPEAVGGVLTFLRTLGDALAAQASWAAVLTLEILPWSVVEPRMALAAPREGCHRLLRVPVPFLGSGEARELMIREPLIQRAAACQLELHRCRPDLLHLRYTDNLAKAMLQLGRAIGSKVVFTLTPDPHRDLALPGGALRPLEAEQALCFGNRLYIADRLLAEADGLLGIAHGLSNSQLLPYFPNLCLRRNIQRKPLRIIPEGIRLDVGAGPQGTTQPLETLVTHAGRHRLDRGELHRPVILNVGRLAPPKGQQRLVAAWAGSRLSRSYNLVLVGGNLRHPDPQELQMMAQVDAVMAAHPELAGRFCHLGALANEQVRRLERALVQSAAENDLDTPQVYLCSSLKEEFGISILEAMSEGFLAVAPVRGGVVTYVENGIGGFLIDTQSTESIRRGAEEVLCTGAYSPGTLQAIAETGRAFVRANLSIQAIAKRFGDFYRRALLSREADSRPRSTSASARHPARPPGSPGPRPAAPGCRR